MFEIQKGKRLTKADMREGNINFIGASAVNNGVTAKIANCEYLHSSNTITVNYNGSVGSSFYQNERFWASDDVNVLYPLFPMNRLIAMFLIPIIQRKGSQYAFVDKWKKEYMEKDSICLPATADGQPDWQYMEQYIADKEKQATQWLDTLQNISCLGGGQRVDNQYWREYMVGNLFPKIVKPSVIHSKSVVQDKNGIPYVVRTKFNNGIKCRVVMESTYRPSPAGTISFGSENSTFFYQPEAYISGRDIYYIDTTHLSRHCCQFIVSCLQTITQRYSYNFGLFPDLLKKEKIKLPATSDGNPDWEYMDAYMRHLESQQILIYLQYQ